MENLLYPVLFEVKKLKGNGNNPLYIVATIKEERVIPQSEYSRIQPNGYVHSSTITISDLISSVNSNETNILANIVEVSNIGNTFDRREPVLSREGWRFAKQIRPDLDRKKKYNSFRLFGRLVQTAFHVTSRSGIRQAPD